MNLHPIKIALILLTIVSPAFTADSTKQPPSSNISHLAETGHFDTLLKLLQDRGPSNSDPQLASLIQRLKLMGEHAQATTDARRKAYEQSLKLMGQQVEAGKLSRAMLMASDAYRLADDPQKLLKKDSVVALVGKSQEAARQAELKGDWLEALNLYSTLERLLVSSTQFHDAKKRSQRNLRQLRMYAPKELAKLFAKRSKKNGTKPSTISEEGWDVMVEGVTLRMYEDALGQAATYHISQTGYKPLMNGAIDGMLHFTGNKALGETFPALKDANEVGKFRMRMIELKQELKKIKGKMEQQQARDTIQKIIESNGQTLRLPAEVLIYELADGSLGVLDQFSVMIWPREIQQWQRHLMGSFVGVGIQIRMNDELKLQVVSPLPGTPAFRAGVLPSDIVVLVDGESTAGWTLDKAVRKITGLQGTEVVLGVERKGVKDTIKYQIKRAKIKIESVRGWEPAADGQWDYMVDKKSRIGYVRVSSFMPQTANDLDAAVNAMQQDGPLGGLILDLRGNPGGLLRSAIDISDRFIEQGNLLSIVSGDGNRTKEYAANRRNTYSNFPVLVLVNDRSASASEIVSGTLQDFGRAMVVGGRSYGKGSVQNLYDLPRFGLKPAKARLKLTTEYYMLPSGDIIHRKPGDKKWGIDPDLNVRMTDQMEIKLMEFRGSVDVFGRKGDAGQPVPTAAQILDKGLDPQLEAAVIILKARQLAKKLALAK
jgi:carboxyl-terminal processing protease